MSPEPATEPGMEASPGLLENTHWTLVIRAKNDSVTALNMLCLAYRVPLIVWLRCRGEKPEDVEDRVQGFFEHLLSHDFLHGVAREKGRFRTFLLTAFKNYLRDQYKHAAAAKRGGGQAQESLNATNGEGELLHAPGSDSPSPDQEYDRAWAGAVLSEALKRLEAECAHNDRTALCAALDPVLFADENAPAYAEIGRSLGMTEAAVKMAVRRQRLRLRELIRDEVRQVVASESDLDAELRYLISLFAKPGPTE
jgi:DNA-directed RNA polymerase specialized sigma24 family protein